MTSVGDPRLVTDALLLVFGATGVVPMAAAMPMARGKKVPIAMGAPGSSTSGLLPGSDTSALCPRSRSSATGSAA
jgi:hypothetical protein